MPYRRGVFCLTKGCVFASRKNAYVTRFPDKLAALHEEVRFCSPVLEVVRFFFPIDEEVRYSPLKRCSVDFLSKRCVLIPSNECVVAPLSKKCVCFCFPFEEVCFRYIEGVKVLPMG